jgi:hypothetical protein
MASKFGYVERGADSQVDWAEVSKGFSDKILGAQQRKQGRAQAVEDLTEVATNIDIPLGANTEWNTRAMEFAQGEVVPKIGNFKRMYDRGEISREKYMTILQRATQSTGKAMNLFENIQQQYGVLMKQSEEGKMSKFTQQNLDKINKFTDLNGMRLVMQDNGNVVANVLVPDGKGGFVNSTDPNDTASMEAIANIYMDSPDIYDASKNITDIATGLGEFQYVFRELANYQKAGTITTVEDITKVGADVNVPDELKKISKDYLAAENGYIQSMMSNPQNLRSLLMDYVGKDPNTGNEYSVCDPGEDCKGSDRVKVFYNSNGQLEADITKEQEEVVENKIRTELRSKIDRTVDVDETGRIRAVTPKPPPKPSPGGANASDFLTSISNLWYGTSEEISTAKTNLGGLNAGIKSILRTPKGVQLTYTTGEQPEFMSFFDEDGSQLSQEVWLRRYSNYFVPQTFQKDYGRVLQGNRYDPNRKLSNVLDDKPLRTMPKDRVIRSMTKEEYDVTGLSKEAATSVLQRTLAKYLDLPKTNIKIMSGRSGWKAIIKPRGDKSGEKSVEISSENGNLLDFIKRNLTNAQATKLTEEMDMG